MTLRVDVTNYLDSPTDFTVQLFNPDGERIWQASGEITEAPDGEYDQVINFYVKNHPNQEGTYDLYFEANGMTLEKGDETYGVSEYHDDAIQLIIKEDKLLVAQAYY